MGDRLLDLVDGLDGMNLRDGGKFVYYASYSPHSPYPAPERLDSEFRDVRYPRTPSFDEEDVSDKYGLSGVRGRMTAEKIDHIDETFRQRVRAVQVLDANVGALVRRLEAQGTLDNTYVVFTSDNGYNMGEHRLDIAKYNQFEETVSVPLLVRGPGIEAGHPHRRAGRQHRPGADDRGHDRTSRRPTGSTACPSSRSSTPVRGRSPASTCSSAAA